MRIPRIELLDGVPMLRLVRAASFDAGVDAVAAAIREAVSQAHPHLLVDAGGVAFRPPELPDRLRMVRLWAQAADGRLRIALVVRPEFIDPERFGVVAASGFGLAGQVFEGVADALAWLRAEHAADLQRAASRPSLDSLQSLDPLPRRRR